MSRWIVLATLVLLLSACGSKHRPARVDEITTKKRHSSQTARKPRVKQSQSSHRVQKGDTLYSIGFRYQMDYKTLAKINGIAAPYRIYPGQTLKLKADPASKRTKNKTTVKTSTITTRPIQSKPLVTSTKPAQKPSLKPANKPTQKPVQKSKEPAVASQRPPKQVIKPAPKVNQVGTLKWSWPTQGRVRSTFLASNPARKGISISGKEGQPVNAAADGVVVYSGSGLLGYGELVIIKHSEHYLSAYGHNKKRLVKEGDVIKRGQTIAELGSSGTNVDNLHFEIRKNGKPVNPLNYVKNQ